MGDQPNPGEFIKEKNINVAQMTTCLLSRFSTDLSADTLASEHEAHSQDRMVYESYFKALSTFIKSSYRCFCISRPQKTRVLQSLTPDQLEVVCLESLALTEWLIRYFLSLLSQVMVVKGRRLKYNSWLHSLVENQLLDLLETVWKLDIESGKVFINRLSQLLLLLAKLVARVDVSQQDISAERNTSGSLFVTIKSFSDYENQFNRKREQLLTDNTFAIGQELKLPACPLKIVDEENFLHCQNMFIALAKALSKLSVRLGLKLQDVMFKDRDGLLAIFIYSTLSKDANMQAASLELSHDIIEFKSMCPLTADQFVQCLCFMSTNCLRRSMDPYYNSAVLKSWESIDAKFEVSKTNFDPTTASAKEALRILNRLCAALEATVMTNTVLLENEAIPKLIYTLLDHVSAARLPHGDNLSCCHLLLIRVHKIFRGNIAKLQVTQTLWTTLESIAILKDDIEHTQSSQKTSIDMDTDYEDSMSQDCSSQDSPSEEEEFQVLSLSRLPNNSLFNEHLTNFREVIAAFKKSMNVPTPQAINEMTTDAEIFFKTVFRGCQLQLIFPRDTRNACVAVCNFLLKNLDSIVTDLSSSLLGGNQLHLNCTSEILRFFAVFSRYRFIEVFKAIRLNSCEKLADVLTIHWKEVESADPRHQLKELIDQSTANIVTSFEALGMIQEVEYLMARKNVLDSILAKENEFLEVGAKCLHYFLTELYDKELYAKILERINSKLDCKYFLPVMDKIFCAEGDRIKLIHDLERRRDSCNVISLAAVTVTCPSCLNWKTEIVFERPISHNPLAEDIMTKILTNFSDSVNLASILESFLIHFGLSENIIANIFALFKTQSKVVQASLTSLLQVCAASMSRLNFRDELNPWVETCFSQLVCANPQANAYMEKLSEVEMVLKLLSVAHNEVFAEVAFLFVRISWANNSEVFQKLVKEHWKISKDRIVKMSHHPGNPFLKNEQCFIGRLIDFLLTDSIQRDRGKLFFDALELFAAVVGGEKKVDAFTPLLIKLTKVCFIEKRRGDINTTQRTNSKNFLNEVISHYLGMNKSRSRRDFVEDVQKAFPKVCSQFVSDDLSKSWNDLMDMIKCLSEVTEVGTVQLFTNSDALAHQLLSLMKQKPESVHQLFSVIYRRMKKENPSANNYPSLNKSMDELMGFISSQGFLFGFLVSFTNKLDNVSDVQKYLTALESLAFIVSHPCHKRTEEIDRSLSALLNKIVPLEGLDEHSKKVIFDIYDGFVSHICDSTLEEKLSEICKDMLPLLDTTESALCVAKFLKKLVQKAVDKNWEFKVAALEFMPVHEELVDVLREIERCKKVCKVDMSELCLDEQLEIYCKDFDTYSENEMKEHYMGTVLSAFIASNIESLLTSESATVKWNVGKIVEKLMGESRSGEEDIKIAVATCFGALGAIDPGWFEEVPLSKKALDTNKETLPEDMSVVAFPCILIEHLCKVIDTKSDSVLLNDVQYAIQEELKHFNVIQDEKNLIWCGLSLPARRKCKPLFISQFHATSIGVDLNTMETPIFRTTKKYDAWISDWTSALIELISDDLLREKFRCLTVLFRHDSGIAHWILSSVIRCVVRDSHLDEDLKNKYIIEEIQEIINTSLPYTPLGQPMVGQQTGPSSVVESKVSVTAAPLVEVQHLCAQTVFAIYDSLSTWKEGNNTMILNFIESLPKDSLASLAYGCQAYTRSLMLLEQHLRPRGLELPIITENYYNLLQKLYIALDEPDGVAGIIENRSNRDELSDQIMAYEATGNLQAAFSCSVKAVELEPNNLPMAKVLVRCALSMGQCPSALNISTGLIASHPSWRSSLAPYQVEAAWKLSDWNSLEKHIAECVTSDATFTTAVGIGQLLLHMRNKNKIVFEKVLNDVRKKEMNPISAAVMEKGAYFRCYQHLVRLHFLNDLEQAANKYFETPKVVIDSKVSPFESLQEIWKTRMETVQETTRYREPIASLHRVLIKMCDDPDEHAVHMARSWLSSARVARKSNNMHLAEDCLLGAKHCLSFDRLNSTAEPELVADVLVESAKHSWAKGDQDSKERALKDLWLGIENNFKKQRLSASLNVTQRPDRNYARLKLLHTMYTEEMQLQDSVHLSESYRDVIKYAEDWEESHFRLAKFHERLADIEDASHRAELLPQVCESFASSLLLGNKHMFESLASLLSVWFELGSTESKLEQLRKKSEKKDLARETRVELEYQISLLTSLKTAFHKVQKQVIERVLVSKLQPHVLMIALSQLLSRICHPNPEVKRSIANIIRKLIDREAYPQQTFWKLISAKNISIASRAQACNELIRNLIQGNSHAKEQYSAIKDFSNDLVALSSKAKGNAATVDLSTSSAYKIFHREQRVKLLVLNMETFSAHQKVGHSTDVYIDRMEKEGTLQSSQVRPMKIEFRGTDGRKYPMLWKPQDDLRKDSRAMEFNEVVNRLLKRDPETRKRQLLIRTYAVLPITEICGLLEWVDHLTSLRKILKIAYKKKNNGNLEAASEMFKANSEKRNTPSQSLKQFKDIILPKMTPAVFGDFFMDQFSDPVSWYMARLNYIRTCALTSIVGYVIGLGDRHLENILLDTQTGSVVHVDFNILFNAGENLQVPERVPFRLTHNLVDAMGPTGYEGVFRKTCEATLRVMRDNKDTMLSVLRPLTYDPIVEFLTKKHESKASQFVRKAVRDKTDEKIVVNEDYNEKAAFHCDNINDRLSGVVKVHVDQRSDRRQTQSRLPLSVSGQVNSLIEEATNLEKLSLMYYGWAPFL